MSARRLWVVVLVLVVGGITVVGRVVQVTVIDGDGRDIHALTTGIEPASESSQSQTSTCVAPASFRTGPLQGRKLVRH